MVLKNKSILVTGAAGFIGAAFVEKLLEEKADVKIIGIDNINDYYNPSLKKERTKNIKRKDKKKIFQFFKVDLKDKIKIIKIFEEFNPDLVINLAAQAGVRYSLENPNTYVESNLVGFLNITS